jgi:hypothetical protein
VIVVKCHLSRHIFLANSKITKIHCRHAVCHQIILLFSDADFAVIHTLQWFSVSSYHTDFSIIHPFQYLSVSSNHLHYDAIKYAFCRAFLELPVTGWAYIKTCPPAIQLQTTLAHHLFIYTQPTHYASENNSLSAPRMERASILPLLTTSKNDHLFRAATYRRRCWVCPDTDASGYVGFYISIS